MGKVITEESFDELRQAMRDFTETMDYDKLPDLKKAQELTDEADRESEDYDSTDEPSPKDGDASKRILRQISSKWQ